MKINLEKRVALVTGSSRGIGKEIALTLAQNGADVIVNYISYEKEAQDVVDQIRAMGRKCIAIQADVTKELQLKNLVETSYKEFSKIDILVNNVGGYSVNTLQNTSLEEWHHIQETNLTSVFLLCKKVIPEMRKRRYGRIVNIALAGVESLRAYTKIPAHAIAKTSVLMLSKSLAKEEAQYGITVNTVSPGYINTGNIGNEEKQKLEQRIPAGRLGKPSDVACTVLFLVSDHADYITGANIEVRVDGDCNKKKYY